MSEGQDKLHLMISLKDLQQQAYDAYLKTFDKYKFATVKTIGEAMSNPCPPLVSIQKILSASGSPGMLNEILKFMIIKTARAFNLNRNLDPKEQLPDLVETIVSEYYFLGLAEVFFILKEARMGRTGKTYERIDEPTVISWFDAYMEKRVAIAIDKSLLNHDKYTSKEKDRQYEGFINNLRIEMNNTQDERVRNLAFGMAKKMIMNDTGPVRATPAKELRSSKKGKNK